MQTEMRRYYKTRKPFTPKSGEWYENAGGGRYQCVCGRSGVGPFLASMRSAGGWRFVAHGIGIYEDGKIDWDFSTGGYFEEVKG